jgi:hypothetical protein
MRRLNLDRDELLTSLTSDLSRDVGELFEGVVPGCEDGGGGSHGALEGRVGHVGEALGGEDAEELRVEVSRDGFDEGEGASDRVRGELELLVEVGEDEENRVLDFREVGGGEELVEREVLHEDVVVVNCGEKGK